MGVDYTVIQAVRQRFGDGVTSVGERMTELEAPFVGGSKEFPFSCPNVDTEETAVLQFESVGVTAGKTHGPRNIVRINDVDIPGGLTAGPVFDGFGPSYPLWKAHTLLVPGAALKEQNILYIESVTAFYGPGHGVDNFIIDNVILFFKNRPRSIVDSVVGETVGAIR